jgi:TonB family protein
MALLTGAVILAVGAVLSLPRGAVAQVNDLTADSCISIGTSPGYMTFTNNCRETVRFKYCMMNANKQGCESAGYFKETIIDSGTYMTLNDNRGFYVRWFGCKPGAVFVERPYDPYFDNERQVRFYCSPSAATLAAQKAADEEHGPLHAEVWTVRQVSAVTPSGKRTCKMAMNHGAFGLDPAGQTFSKVRYAQPGPFDLYWRGACDQGGWIEGAGKLSLQSIDDFEGEVVRHIYVGRAVRGRLTGPTSYSRIYSYCEYDDACDPFQPTNNDELGIQLNLTFVEGCNNWKRATASKCVPARGLALVGSPAPTPPAKPAVGIPAAPIPSVATTVPKPPRAHPAAEYARPTVSISGLFGVAGYPELAKAREEQGQTYYSVTVNGAGMPTRCDITGTSGSAALDARTCEVVMKGGRFAPDPAGPTATLRRYDGGVSWKLP